MGFLSRRYGPRITRRLGGSNGAGVPFPSVANARTQLTANPRPTMPTRLPNACDNPKLRGARKPAMANISAGTNQSRNPANSVAYASARIRVNMGTDDFRQRSAPNGSMSTARYMHLSAAARLLDSRCPDLTNPH